ncbi:hypothetical protein QUA81_23610 [Microcoleus sp. F6_B4]
MSANLAFVRGDRNLVVSTGSRTENEQERRRGRERERGREGEGERAIREQARISTC